MMTGRYPTRTGFEFTPTPDRHGQRSEQHCLKQMNNNLPPSFYDQALEATQPAYELKGLASRGGNGIAETLKASGYYTAHVGKWHLGR